MNPQPMKNSQTDQPIEMRKIADLKPHPAQDRLYRPASERELAELADQMRGGIYDPVEITPDGVIIDGHQRVCAATKLGWIEVRVKVRDDLAGDETAIARRHIAANRVRRQLDPLDQVRLIVGELELEWGRPIARWSDREMAKLRERVRQVVGQSNRHVQRLINIVRTPLAVQAAVSKDELAIVDAAKVSNLPQAVQQEIAAAIRAGGEPKKVVGSFLAKCRKPRESADKELEVLVAALERAIEALRGREAEIGRGATCLILALETLRRFDGLATKLKKVLRAEIERDERLDTSDLPILDDSH